MTAPLTPRERVEAAIAALDADTFKDVSRADVICQLAAELEEANRRREAAERQLVETQAQLIWVFDLDSPPIYVQGNEPLHETMSIVTAKEVQGLVNRITRYREKYGELE